MKKETKLQNIPVVSGNINESDMEKECFLLSGRLFGCGTTKLYDSIKRVAVFLSGHTLREENFLELQDYLNDCVGKLNGIFGAKCSLMLEPYRYDKDANGYSCGIFSIKSVCKNTRKNKNICDIYLYRIGSPVSFQPSGKDMVFASDARSGVRRWYL